MERRTRQLAKRQRTWFRHQLRAATVAGTPDEAERIAARIARDALDS
jgi:tRNA A37 N6-isopentenylltransferase MiaA